VVGYYADSSTPYAGIHGYVRWKNGTFTTFDDPDSNSSPVNTTLNAINAPPEAFVRFANGAIVPFAAPEPGQLGTEPFAVNGVNEFTGYWVDANFNGHGFVALALPW
jgi:hypothetical protein